MAKADSAEKQCQQQGDVTLAILQEAEAKQEAMRMFDKTSHGSGLCDIADLCGLLERHIDEMKDGADALTYSDLNGISVLVKAIRNMVLEQIVVMDDFCTALEHVDGAVRRRKALQGL